LPALPTFSRCVVTCTVPAVAASAPLAASTHKTPVFWNLLPVSLALQLDQVDSVRLRHAFISLYSEHAPQKINDSNNSDALHSALEMNKIFSVNPEPHQLLSPNYMAPPQHWKIYRRLGLPMLDFLRGLYPPFCSCARCMWI